LERDQRGRGHDGEERGSALRAHGRKNRTAHGRARRSGLFRSCGGDAALRGSDVADELLGHAVRALVLPVAVAERRVLRGVLEVELAPGEALRARELRARAEERRDEGGGVAATRGVTGRVRVVRATGDRAGQVAAELALDARRHHGAVLALRIALAGARAGQRDERALVLPG